VSEKRNFWRKTKETLRNSLNEKKFEFVWVLHAKESSHMEFEINRERGGFNLWRGEKKKKSPPKSGERK